MFGGQTEMLFPVVENALKIYTWRDIDDSLQIFHNL